MSHYEFTLPISSDDIKLLHVKDTVTLNGPLFGIRDATFIAILDKSRRIKFDLSGAALLHTAPNVKKMPVSGKYPAGYAPICIGTTTSARMERFTYPMMDKYGVRIFIGKGGLMGQSLNAFVSLGGVYLTVVGGAAALETTWIDSIDDVDLDDLNPESLWKFRVKRFGPLMVSMDSYGKSLYQTVIVDAAARRARALAMLGVQVS